MIPKDSVHFQEQYSELLLKMKIFKQFHKYLQPFPRKFFPPYGAFSALKRYSSLIKYFYPQYITWNWDAWRPELTPKYKLIPWFLGSLAVLLVNFSFIYIGFREILAYTKDPEITFTHVMLLEMYTNAASLASVSILSYILEGSAINFALGNLQTIKPDLDADGNLNLK